MQLLLLLLPCLLIDTIFSVIDGCVVTDSCVWNTTRLDLHDMNFCWVKCFAGINILVLI